MKKKIIIILLLFFVVQPESVNAQPDYIYKEYYSLVGRKIKKGKSINTVKPFIGITSHHLPTAAPLLDNFYGQLKKARPDIKTFLIIGPDHFEKCKQKFVTSNKKLNTMFGELKVDNKLYNELIGSGIKKEGQCFIGEHSIGVQANYIKKFFPKSEVVPILLSYSAKNKNFQNTIKVLKKRKADIFIVQSTDFAHYVNAKQARVVDETSRKMIGELNGDSFSLKQIDSPGSIKLMLQLAKELRLKPEIIEHKNSFDFNGAFNNTTSYFSIFF